MTCESTWWRGGRSSLSASRQLIQALAFLRVFAFHQEVFVTLAFLYMYSYAYPSLAVRTTTQRCQLFALSLSSRAGLRRVLHCTDVRLDKLLAQVGLVSVATLFWFGSLLLRMAFGTGDTRQCNLKVGMLVVFEGVCRPLGLL